MTDKQKSPEMTPLDEMLADIEAKAGAATPGPWKHNGDHFPVCTMGNSNEDGQDHAVAGNGYKIRDGAHSDARDDAAFVARLDPPTALALVRMVRELQEAARKIENGCAQPFAAQVAMKALANVNRIAEELK